ncbi:MAG: hypothetical protein CL609_23645 [Anaerolineaceae bacterium]|nr:hypothetical protein [Anaerolineaceae bacterium]
MENNPVSAWFVNKYLDWQKANETLSSMAEFARYLGVGDKALNTWVNGRNNPSYKKAVQICEKLNDFSLLEMLGYSIPESERSPLDSLPPDFRLRLEAASAEVERVLEERGLTGESPEAESIVIEIFEHFGFKYTNTEI